MVHSLRNVDGFLTTPLALVRLSKGVEYVKGTIHFNLFHRTNSLILFLSELQRTERAMVSSSPFAMWRSRAPLIATYSTYIRL